MYSTRYGNEGFERFSVAHEIAHYLLEGHIDHVLKSGEHHSHAGFTSADPFELEADHFAAGLLMPEDLFKVALKRRDSDLAAIEHMASICKTSLTATAIRVSELAADAIAVVISTGPSIDYCVISGAMKTLPQLNWLRKGSPVPRGTETASFNADPKRIQSGGTHHDRNRCPRLAWRETAGPSARGSRWARTVRQNLDGTFVTVNWGRKCRL